MSANPKKNKNKNDLDDFITFEPLPDLVDEDDTIGIDHVLDVLPSETDEGTDDETLESDMASSDLLSDTFEDEADSEEDASALDAGLINMSDVVADLDDGDTTTTSDDNAPQIEDWFDDMTDEPIPQDDGEEGPISDEIFNIDTDQWASLDGEHPEEEESESVLETMARLDLSIEEELTPKPPSPTNLTESVDSFFIGPKNGELQAILIHDGVPIGVGDTLYLSGADQMLYAEPTSDLDNIQANTLAAYSDTLFFGTDNKGALRFEEKSRQIRPINSWLTAGLSSDDSARINTCSTKFLVAGQTTKLGFRLLGWTGEGQLYSSLDEGETWTGPLLKGRSCISLKTSPKTDHVLILASTQDGSCELLSSQDLVTFHPLMLPSDSGPLSPQHTVFDVTGEVIAVGSDSPSHSLFVSEDGGLNWRDVNIHSITALVIDPETPNWMAVSQYGQGDTSIIHISEDGGKQWKQVFTLASPKGPRQSVTRIASHNQRPYSIMAMTESGAYLIVFEQKELTH